MPQHLILSVISDDKPGIVKTIAEAVSSHGGSWLESRLAQLDGKFAGIIRVSIAEDKAELLHSSLSSLASVGIDIKSEVVQVRAAAKTTRQASFSLAGPDRNGIVHELANAFAEYNINVTELTTHCSSMPYSGEPLFEAEGMVEIPADKGIEPLLEQLDAIADALALDIHLDEV